MTWPAITAQSTEATIVMTINMDLHALRAKLLYLLTGEGTEAQKNDLAKDTDLASGVGTYPTPSERSSPCLLNLLSHLVDLSDNSVHNFPFKGPENNGLVLNWIKDKTSAWLDHTSTNIVDGGDSNYKAIPVRRMRKKRYCMWKSF